MKYSCDKAAVKGEISKTGRRIVFYFVRLGCSLLQLSKVPCVMYFTFNNTADSHAIQYSSSSCFGTFNE